MTPILELRNIDYSYHTLDGETKALSNISFTLTRGEFVSVVGPSGCGKSTLLSLIDGLMQPESGEMLLNGQPLTENSATCCSTTTSSSGGASGEMSCWARRSAAGSPRRRSGMQKPCSNSTA